MVTDTFSEILGIANLLGAAQGIFLTSIIAFRSSRNPGAARFLALFVLSFSLAIAGTMLGAFGYYQAMPHLIRVGDPFVWLFGPSLFMYVKLLRDGQAARFHSLHFAPFIIYVLYMIPAFYLLPAEMKIIYVETTMTAPDSGLWTLTLLRMAHVGIYVFVLLAILRRHRAAVEETYSDIARLSLDWMRRLIYAFVFVWAVAMFFYVVAFGGWIVFLQANYLIAFVMSIIVYAIGYIGMQQPPLHEQPATPPNATRASTPTGLRIVDQRTQLVFDAVKSAMQSDRLWLNSDLNIQDLADHVRQPKYLVSAAINELGGMSFHDFVNAYRVEHVKKCLKDPSSENYTILAIAMESGFNTKSSFNTAFRRHTGMTPSAFKSSLTNA